MVTKGHSIFIAWHIDHGHWELETAMSLRDDVCK